VSVSVIVNVREGACERASLVVAIDTHLIVHLLEHRRHHPLGLVVVQDALIALKLPAGRGGGVRER